MEGIWKFIKIWGPFGVSTGDESMNSGAVSRKWGCLVTLLFRVISVDLSQLPKIVGQVAQVARCLVTA